MFKAIPKLLAVAIVGMSTTACLGISKGNPLSLVPASELALIRSSAPREGGRISVDDLLAKARAKDEGKPGPTAAPAVRHLDLRWDGDAVQPEPGHLVSIGRFVAAAPQQKITISCGSSLDVAGLRAHRRALSVVKLLGVMGVPSELKRDPDMAPESLRLVRGGRSA